MVARWVHKERGGYSAGVIYINPSLPGTEWQVFWRNELWSNDWWLRNSDYPLSFESNFIHTYWSREKCPVWGFQ